QFALPGMGKNVLGSNADVGHIEFTLENSEIISASLIDDFSKSESILEMLMEEGTIEISEDHKNLLRETLRSYIGTGTKIIPDMIQVINKEASENAGRMVKHGENKGVWVNMSQGAQIAGNTMSAAEVYVHELGHAAKEYALERHKDELANTMHDIGKVYEEFLNVVTVDDLMPPISGFNRAEERRIATDLLFYLKNHETGINEFMNMVESNMYIRDIIENKVFIKDIKYNKAETLWQHLKNLIAKLYDFLRSFKNGDDKNLNGLRAMEKYIARIHNINNVAIGEVTKQNETVALIAKGTDFMNDLGKNMIDKITDTITKEKNPVKKKELQEELARIKALSGKDQTYLDKIKIWKDIFVKGTMSNSLADRGLFETWVASAGDIAKAIPFGVFKDGLLKEEGDIQQIAMAFRDTDDQAARVENLGLESQKIEDHSAHILKIQADLIVELFDNELSNEDSVVLTKSLLDLELDVLFNEDLNESDAKNLTMFKEVLTDEKALENKINEVKYQLEAILKKDTEYNLVTQQAAGLGKQMVTGDKHSAQLQNAFMIYGKRNLETSIHGIIKEHEDTNSKFTVALIEKLIALEALTHQDTDIKKRTAELVEKHETAVLGTMTYNRNSRDYARMYNGKQDYKYDMSRIMGRKDKIKSNYMQVAVDFKANEITRSNDYFNVADGISKHDEFNVYLNSSFTELGWRAEGMRTTNIGEDIFSYINPYGEALVEADGLENQYDIEKMEERKKTINIKLLEFEKEVNEELRAMQKPGFKPKKTGMRAAYSVNKKGDIYVSDMDIAIDTRKLENQMHTNNSLDTVIGKSFARTLDENQSKKNSEAFLDLIEFDASENFNYLREDNVNSDTNAMAYVRIGLGEDNKISKMIWPVIPRYVKVQIAKKHYLYKMRDIQTLINSTLGFATLDMKNMISDKTQDLEFEIKNHGKGIDADIQGLNKLYRALHRENKVLLDAELERLGDTKEVKEFRVEMKKIQDSPPFISVRRNLALHYFGNREASIFGDNKSKGLINLPKGDALNYIVKALKVISAIWKELVKNNKADIAVRNIPLIFFNIVSNFLLNLVKGNDPFSELKAQWKGIVFLNRYLDNKKEFDKLEVKAHNGMATTAEIDRMKLLKNKIKDNPAGFMVTEGLYSSLAEDLGDARLTSEGMLDEKIKKHTGWIPDGVKNVLKAIYMTKDTKAFSGLLLMMQSGDFAARYARYQKLIAQGVAPHIAKKEVLDNQINYGWGGGLIEQWLNSYAGVIFTSFWKNIQKVIRQTTMDKPFNVLLSVLTGGVVFDESVLAYSMLVKTPTIYGIQATVENQLSSGISPIFNNF
ncbi:MAG: hypothetical protein KAH01_07200, partial [Caldisericia bacterium]|nr:hypothetical protein [Caldisericia bacterium]